jgi:hypothetical protein
MMDAGNQRAEETAVRGTAGRADTTTGADAEGSIRHEARSDVQQGGGERIENAASVVIGVNDVTGGPDRAKDDDWHRSGVRSDVTTAVDSDGGGSDRSAKDGRYRVEVHSEGSEAMNDDDGGSHRAAQESQYRGGVRSEGSWAMDGGAGRAASAASEARRIGDHTASGRAETDSAESRGPERVTPADSERGGVHASSSPGDSGHPGDPDEPDFPGDPAPVGYSVAVEKYLDAASLSDGSRRVYRIALNTWAWLLVERTPPRGRERRGVVEPMVPLAVLDGADAAGRLWSAVRVRADEVDARTLERELSTLRGAVSWWYRRGWLGSDHAGALRPDVVAPRFPAVRLTRAQVRSVFGLRAGLREQTLWHMVYDGAGQIWQILELDVGDLDETRTGTHARTAHAVRVRARAGASAAGSAAGASAGAGGGAGTNSIEALRWRAETAELVRMLVAGRATGPVFLTDRKAAPDTPGRDRCPITGRGRLSYRRAAEIFTTATRPLDLAGRGWTLGQLRAAGPATQGHRVAGERVSGLS